MRRRVPIAVVFAGIALLAGACGRAGDRLLVVGRARADQAGSRIWAVAPGEELGDGNLVAAGTQGPVKVATVNDEGLLWTNTLGRAWKDKVLLGTTTAGDAGAAGGAGAGADAGPGGARVTVGDPGADPVTLGSGAQLDVLVTRRGVMSSDAQGCTLATGTSADDRARVGTGLCSLSDDDRWVASWPEKGGPLRIRDLRSGKVHKVAGNFTDAMALGRDATVIGIEPAAPGAGRGADGAGAGGAGDSGRATAMVARVIDATNGEVIGSTGTAESLQTVPLRGNHNDSFTLAARDGEQFSLWSVSTDAKVSTIAKGATGDILLPVTTSSGWVIYVEATQTEAGKISSKLMRWTPGSGNEELMSGELAVVATSAEDVLVMEQTNTGVRFWHTEGGKLADDPDLTMRTDTSEHVAITRAVVLDGVAHLVIAGLGAGPTAGPTRSSYVHIDLDGADDGAPVRNWSQLALAALDNDGTALVAGIRSAGTKTQQLLVVGPRDDRYHVRAEAADGNTLAGAFIHHDTIWFTRFKSDGASSVWKVPASESRGKAPVRLYGEALAAGATWPELGGGVSFDPVDAIQLSVNAQAQAQAQQAQGQGQGQGQGQAQGQGQTQGQPGGVQPQG